MSDDLPTDSSAPAADAGLFGDSDNGAASAALGGGFQVSARKYRPQGFDEMIGQDVLVRTLQNAIRSGRIAHAFIMTGERGTGKTTTARIIARALNCLDGDGPQLNPCGRCANCQAIASSSHVDVLEIDAASRTGVDDMREVIDSVPYRPVQARYKVYIIDEVHMLSKSAFNALLKTLEEPPEHVKFIFATTEINKVPITVLSRCQRFDLRRVPAALLSQHFAKICQTEALSYDEEALALLARAADGSVRDGLSLLDQAIAQSAPDADPRLQVQAVTLMLGSADGSAVLDLLELCLSGQVAMALTRFDDMYAKGAQPKLVLRDLADRLHLATRLKVAPEMGGDGALSSEAQSQLATLAKRLSLPALMRAWQIVSQGLEAFGGRNEAKQLADMVLIKLGYAADLPDPKALVDALVADSTNGEATGQGSGQGTGQAAAPEVSSGVSSGPSVDTAGAAAGPGASASPARAAQEARQNQQPEGQDAPPPPSPDAYAAPPQPAEIELDATVTPRASTQTAKERKDAQAAPTPATPKPEAEPEPEPEPEPLANPQSFDAVIALFEGKRKPREAADLKRKVALDSFATGHLRLVPREAVSRAFVTEIASSLQDWTGQTWQVELVQAAPSSPAPQTVAEQQAEQEAKDRQAALAHPEVQKVLTAFPQAKLTEVRSLH